ncbi:MAG: ribosomal-protein-alanine N-acetyltransferase [SAR86 cluster bacterium]|uniref:[Ribosomal protein bS18]-alanine N-acetyltransferase n=1 Tax=SAR86 cluster bacterium TaxID=2030880 RepID=A0A2A4MWL1_9GAMM|nr:MAG: ribosomal-protein-alanine N-acetyltransferase [SAR86 cluster bacterium]
MTDFYFRTMRPSDLELVVENENIAYEHPWSKRVFIDCLRSGHECWVLANGSVIAAHGVLSVAVGESHLLTLCVNPQYQRLGLGRRLLEHLLTQASVNQASVCFLEVRLSNKAAISLYKRLGFLQIGERPNYYPSKQGREDALIFSVLLPSGEVEPSG